MCVLGRSETRVLKVIVLKIKKKYFFMKADIRGSSPLWQNLHNARLEPTDVSLHCETNDKHFRSSACVSTDDVLWLSAC